MRRNLLTFIIGAALLALFGAAAVTRTSPAYGQSLPTQTPVAPTLTPFLTPTPTLPVLALTPAGGCSPALQLTLGTQVLVDPGLNVRATPSVSGALLSYLAEEKLLRLIDGPVCANGYNWWRVSGFGEPGWIIEGTPNRYYIAPYTDPNTVNCFPTQPGMQVGATVRAVTGSRVRAEADAGAFVVTVANAGSLLTILEGPRCLDGLVWWRVRANYAVTNAAVEGWVAEGYPGEIYIEPLSAGTATAQPCVRPLNWSVGMRGAAVARGGVARRLRAEANANAPLVLELLDGVAFEVLAAPPVCSGGYNWWNVRILTTGITGWIAEGVPGAYNVETIVR